MLLGGVEFLADEADEHAARSVSYKGDTDTLAGIAATIGTTMFRLDPTVGASVEFSDRDYLIRKTLLGSQFPPKRGHRITDSDGTYEVNCPAPDEPVWRPSDPFSIRLRIHTKRVG